MMKRRGIKSNYTNGTSHENFNLYFKSHPSWETILSDSSTYSNMKTCMKNRPESYVEDDVEFSIADINFVVLCKFWIIRIAYFLSKFLVFKYVYTEIFT